VLRFFALAERKKRNTKEDEVPRSRYPLIPESRGKRTRGLALLDTPIQAEAMPPNGLERARAVGASG